MTDLLRADHLTRHFKIGGTLARGTLHAVDDVSFAIGEREIVALAGESGSGKSTVARLLARVYKPTAGSVTCFDGARRREAAVGAAVPARRAALQRPGPDGVPGPVQLAQPGVPGLARRAARAQAAPALSCRPPSGGPRRPGSSTWSGLGADMLGRYPHELSGGQRQRVGFAQALATRPRLILADEPVSMLDTSIRIGLLNLMAKLRDEEGVSILYITHDIASARYVADRLIVMYAGQIAETGPIEDVLAAPQAPLHPAAAVRACPTRRRRRRAWRRWPRRPASAASRRR